MKNSFLVIICSLLSFNSFGQVKLDSGLIAFYNFNNNVQNQAGNHSDGTLVGATYSTSKSSADSSCLKFDGVNDYVQIPIDSFVLNTYSYSLWTKTITIPSPSTCKNILSIGGAGGDQTFQLCNSVRSINPSILTGYYGGGYVTGPAITRGSDSTLPDTSKWYHLALVRFGMGMKFYVNCKLIDSIYDGSAAIYGNQTSFKLGSRFSSTNHYNGYIDNVRVYNRAISAEEVSTLGQCRNTSLESLDALKKSNFKLTPNPGTTQLNIDNLTEHTRKEIFIYDMLGTLVYSTSTWGTHQMVPISSWSAGTFVVQVVEESGATTNQKFVKL